MELRHLKYFVAVADHLNFRQAARFLGMAQPPLSVQIRKLEDELGCALFLRENRRIRLTPAGHTFLAGAKETLARAEQSIQRVQDEAAGREGSLKIAFSDGVLSESVTKRLRKFFRSRRGLRVSFWSTKVGDSQGADALITDFTESELPPAAIPLERARPQIAVPPKHRLADRADFLPADLIGETLFVSVSDQRSAAERLLVPQLERSVLVSAPMSDSLQHRFWQVSLGLGLCFCSSADRGSLDARRTPLGGDAGSLVIALVPNAASRAGGLPALIEAIRS